jgi:hypothetical protein
MEEAAQTEMQKSFGHHQFFKAFNENIFRLLQLETLWGKESKAKGKNVVVCFVLVSSQTDVGSELIAVFIQRRGSSSKRFGSSFGSKNCKRRRNRANVCGQLQSPSSQGEKKNNFFVSFLFYAMCFPGEKE